ncbi:MAG: hypothetical protein H7A51_15060 [Akkermansiaceae bacterium]|nr:hypothetical protein [Akkermansiaceae bacterium]
MHHHIEDRPERIDVPSIYQNPSAPLTDEMMEGFIREAMQILADSLSELEHGKEAQPC